MIPVKLLLDALVIGIVTFGETGSVSDDEKSTQVLSISSSRRSPTICLTLKLAILVRLVGGAGGVIVRCLGVRVSGLDEARARWVRSGRFRFSLP